MPAFSVQSQNLRTSGRLHNLPDNFIAADYIDYLNAENDRLTTEKCALINNLASMQAQLDAAKRENASLKAALYYNNRTF